MNEFDIIRENLDSIEDKLRDRDENLYDALEEMHRYKDILLEFLKSKIGQKIYWAHKDWFKYETYIISSVSTDIQKSDFFGYQYVGKECIRIYLEDGGYYIADNIGKTLFFNEDEAKLHTCKR